MRWIGVPHELPPIGHEASLAIARKVPFRRPVRLNTGRWDNEDATGSNGSGTCLSTLLSAESRKLRKFHTMPNVDLFP
jgi:hypothetical protein